MITRVQAFELLFILCAIGIAIGIAFYEFGIIIGRRRAPQEHQDPPDLTVKLKHVPPTTAELFRQAELEAGYDTTPLGRLVQPGYRRYGQERTTDFITQLAIETDRYIASWDRQPDSHPYPEGTVNAYP